MQYYLRVIQQTHSRGTTLGISMVSVSSKLRTLNAETIINRVLGASINFSSDWECEQFSISNLRILLDC